MRYKYFTKLLLCGALFVSAGFGQATSSAVGNRNLSFEVAVIRPSAPDEREQWALSPSDFRVTNQTLTSEIEFGYGISNYQLVNQPHWADTARYNFSGKANEPTIIALNQLAFPQQLDQMKVMVRNLLADRCKLKVHWETRDLPVFSLVVDKHGSKLESVPTDVPSSLATDNGYIRSRGISMDEFASRLESFDDIGGRKVVDKTGLSGFYSLTLRWKPTTNTSDSPGISFFTALPDTLGLRLVPGKAPVRILVIDQLERPSEN